MKVFKKLCTLGIAFCLSCVGISAGGSVAQASSNESEVVTWTENYFTATGAEVNIINGGYSNNGNTLEIKCRDITSYLYLTLPVFEEYRAGEKVHLSFRLNPNGMVGSYGSFELCSWGGVVIDYAYEYNVWNWVNYDATILEINGKNTVMLGFNKALREKISISEFTVDDDVFETDGMFGGVEVYQYSRVYTIKAGDIDANVITAANLKTMTDWTEISFRTIVTAAQSNFKSWQMNTQEGISLIWLDCTLPMEYISMKDVTFTKYVPVEKPADTAEITLTAIDSGAGAGKYATTIISVDDSIAVGSNVTVTMTVALSAATNYSRIHAIKQGDSALTSTIVYGHANEIGGDASAELAVLKSGEYVTITFSADVIENGSYTYYGASIPTMGKGVALLFISMENAGDFVWIKDVEISAPLSATADYTYEVSNLGSDVKNATYMYFAVDDSFTVGQKVNVTMTVAVETTGKLSYTNFRTSNPDTPGSSMEVYGTLTNSSDVQTMYDWYTITFTTVVVDETYSWQWNANNTATNITEKCVWMICMCSATENDVVYVKDVSITAA